MKVLFLILLFANILFSKNYNFTEIRYSDALNKQRVLEGTIDFFDKGFHIYYKKTSLEVNYKNSELRFIQKGKKVAISQNELLYLSKFFHLIFLIHQNNFSLLKDSFKVKYIGEITFLYPIDSAKEYIKKIKIIKDKNEITNITTYMNNGDYIEIGIGHEIY